MINITYAIPIHKITFYVSEIWLSGLSVVNNASYEKSLKELIDNIRCDDFDLNCNLWVAFVSPHNLLKMHIIKLNNDNHNFIFLSITEH